MSHSGDPRTLFATYLLMCACCHCEHQAYHLEAVATSVVTLASVEVQAPTQRCTGGSFHKLCTWTKPFCSTLTPHTRMFHLHQFTCLVGGVLVFEGLCMLVLILLNLLLGFADPNSSIPRLYVRGVFRVDTRAKRLDSVTANLSPGAISYSKN